MTKILDSRGRPLLFEALNNPQTSRIGHIRREWAEHPSRGLTPQRLHRILEDAEQGNLVAQADLFTDMEEKDGHIYAEMSKRKSAILTLGWEIVEPVNADAQEKKHTAMLREWVDAIPDFEDALLAMMDAVGHGFAALEIAWQRCGSVWLPASLDYRPQRWFQTLMHDGNTLRLRDGTAHGQMLWPFGWVVHKHRARSGMLPRAGLHRTLAWPYLFKNYGVRDLAEFLEIYGLPLRLGKYPSGATDQEKATLLRAVAEIGHNAAGIVPEGMLIEFQSAAQGTHDPFAAMIDWCERTQSKVILGGTLTSQADGASSTNALGNVHNEVRHDLLASDARQVAASITRDLIWPLRALNVPGANPMRSPAFVFDVRRFEDLSTFAQALPSLVSLGMKIPTAWAHEKLNIPVPQAEQEVLKVEQPAGFGGMGGFGLLSARAGTHPIAVLAARPDVASAQAARLADDVAPVLDDWIDKIRALVERAGSLQELRDGLLALAPDMRLDQFADAMQDALTAAALAGRADIVQQAGIHG